MGVDQAAADLAKTSSQQSNLVRSYYSFFLRRRMAHNCVGQMFPPKSPRRRQFQVHIYLKIWTAKLQHRAMLGMCITDEEAQDPQVMQGRSGSRIREPRSYYSFSFVVWHTTASARCSPQPNVPTLRCISRIGIFFFFFPKDLSDLYSTDP